MWLVNDESIFWFLLFFSRWGFFVKRRWLGVGASTFISMKLFLARNYDSSRKNFCWLYYSNEFNTLILRRWIKLRKDVSKFLDYPKIRAFLNLWKTRCFLHIHFRLLLVQLNPMYAYVRELYLAFRKFIYFHFLPFEYWEKSTGGIVIQLSEQWNGDVTIGLKCSFTVIHLNSGSFYFYASFSARLFRTSILKRSLFLLFFIFLLVLVFAIVHFFFRCLFLFVLSCMSDLVITFFFFI